VRHYIFYIMFLIIIVYRLALNIFVLQPLIKSNDSTDSAFNVLDMCVSFVLLDMFKIEQHIYNVYRNEINYLLN